VIIIADLPRGRAGLSKRMRRKKKQKDPKEQDLGFGIRVVWFKPLTL
jgi:hypothetical protein